MAGKECFERMIDGEREMEYMPIVDEGSFPCENSEYFLSFCSPDDL